MISRKNLLIILVFLLAGFIRFYNFSDRINFGPEQAISLIVSGDYLKDKFSLLGQPNIQRTTRLGHIIFSPAMFNYSLIPLLLIFNYDPVLITYYFGFLNLITGLVLFLLVKKIYKFKVAIFASILFLFNSIMIYHSTFIWTHHYIPILNIFIFYLLYRFRTNRNNLTPFLLGFLTSLCLSPEYFYFFTLLVILSIMIYLSKRKIADGILFSLGVLLGSFPTILFDVKHGFYHLSTLWEYALDTIISPTQNKISYYHFLQFWPLMALLGGLLLTKLYSKNKLFTLALITAYLYINFNSDRVSFTNAVDMDGGMTVSKIDNAARFIASDNPHNFNVSSTLNYDSPRAYPIRYFLRFKYNTNPKGIEDYNNLDSLYVLSYSGYNFNTTDIWEITVQRPFNLKHLTNIDQNYDLFKLTELSN